MEKSQNNDKEISLSKDKLADSHWDYNYVKTVNSAQGATSKYTIGIDNPDSPLANLTRLYVALSRATDHYRMYTTEDKKLLLRVLQNDGDKYSALEVLREFITEKNREDKTIDNIILEDNKKTIREKIEHKQSNNNTKLNVENNNNQSNSKQNKSQNSINNDSNNPKIKQQNQKEYYDKNKVLKALNENCENVVISLLGQPNEKYSDARTWAFGNKTGSLHVTMTGEHRGLWRDWSGSNKDHGNLLTLIMREEGLSFKDAVDRGAQLAYVTPEIKEINPNLTKRDNTKSPTKTFKSAQKIWNHAKNIKNTLAETYLKETRGITNTDNIKDIRFTEKAYSSETKQNYPAIITAFKDKDSQLKGIEIIYLDKETSNKADLNIQKRSLGSKASFGIELQGKPQKDGVSFMAEGIETTLSIRDSVGENSHIIAISGKGNFTNINPEMLSDAVVLCLDNDGINTEDQTVNETISRLESAGKTVYSVMPNEAKTDFNDLLKTHGTDTIKDKIIHDIAKEFNINDESDLRKITQIVLDKHSDFDKNTIEKIKDLATEIKENHDKLAEISNQSSNKDTKNNDKNDLETDTKNMPVQDKSNALFDYELTL